MLTRLLRFVLLVCGALAVIAARGVDVQRFDLLKGVHYYQIDEGAALLQTNNAYRFTVDVYADSLGDVLGASVYTPKLQTLALVADQDGNPFRFREKFDKALSLENNFPDGSYALSVSGARDGDHTMPFTLTGGLYPPAPVLNDYNGAQNLPFNEYNEISWQPISGATTNDFVQFSIQDPQSHNVWQTPDFGETGALNGLATHTIIPADTLNPGEVYVGTIQFIKVVQSASRAYPGARGTVGYYSRTDFVLRPLSVGVNPAVDRLQLWRTRRLEQTVDLPPTIQPKGWEFFSQVDAVDTNKISAVQITLPDGETHLFDTNSSLTQFQFSDQSLSDPIQFASVYKDGPYAIDVTRADNSVDHAVVNLPAGSFPPDPNLQNVDTFVGHPGGQDLTVSWDPWVGASGEDFIRVELFDDGNKTWDTPSYSSAKRLPPDTTSVTIPGANFIPGHEIRLLVHFYHVDVSDTRVLPGALTFGGFDSRTKFTFTNQLPDVTAFGIAEGRFFWQRGTDTYEADPKGPYVFQASASAATTNSLRSVEMTTPKFGPTALQADTNQTTFGYMATKPSSDSLTNDFPTGNYQFNFETLNDGLRTSLVTLTSTELPPLPHVQAFTKLGAENSGDDIAIAWDPWVGMNTNTDKITVTLEDSLGHPKPQSDIDISNNVVTLQKSLNLGDNKTYVARLRFERRLHYENATYPGARGSVALFSEVAFYVTTLVRSDFKFPSKSTSLFLPSGTLQFAIANLIPGRTYNFSFSTDFKTWTPISTFVANQKALTFTNAISLDREFFRMELLP